MFKSKVRLMLAGVVLASGTVQAAGVAADGQKMVLRGIVGKMR